MKMANSKNAEKCHIFTCELCDFKCSKKSNYVLHLETMKHKMLTHANEKMPKYDSNIFICICGNKYNHKSSFSRHKRTCILVNSSSIKIKEENDDTYLIDDKDIINNKNENNIQGYIHSISSDDHDICCDGKITITKEIFIKLLKDNEEMMKMIKSLSENQLTTPHQVINNNNITNNNINNNTNNNFNLNIFLNEKCKDALNISEFIDSLKITLDDLLFSKTNGITRGITDVMIKGLKELDIYKRPIHCTDIKRDIMYIKNEDKWHKDNNHDMFKNTIIQVANKERSALQRWANDNPDWIETESKQIEYLTMVRSICEPIENYNNYERKIIKNIGKEIQIDRKN
jgi:hypothetical protein